MLGLDCGGTHTDAALLLVDENAHAARLLASAKTATIHDNLPQSIETVLKEMGGQDSGWIKNTDRVTLGTTLLINAVVRDRIDKVGLAVSAGPGLDPSHFLLGDYCCVVPGGLDHRGVEVGRLYLEPLRQDAARWPEEGVKAIVCVGKFSPRNPAHELAMAKICEEVSGLPVTMGHKLSGRLNFPRRIATAYYNAAVASLQKDFLNAVEKSLRSLGLAAQPRLLKADGGAIPFSLAAQQPAHSILSGPAASVMGMMALGLEKGECGLLLDIGGTTTDIALVYKGSPVIDRDGMKIRMRRTLVNSLASISIGIGGDSLLRWRERENGQKEFVAGPDRLGAAMAFGGSFPTLLDALNVRDNVNVGNANASRQGLEKLAVQAACAPEELAEKAVEYAIGKITRAAYALVEGVNGKAIYTLAGLKNISEARPEFAVVAGGPAACFGKRLEAALGMPLSVSPHFDVANAIGAALTLPTASLEIYVDGARGTLSAPALGMLETTPPSFTQEAAEKRACDILRGFLHKNGIGDAAVEVVESDLFAVLDDRGRGSRDIRVVCQARPGICARVV